MPVMDGFAFLEEFDKLPDNVKSNCKVIVLSSSISPEDINRASINPYVVKYVNKPLNERYLDAINF
jgi:CheY-like chemotaxis protein